MYLSVDVLRVFNMECPEFRELIRFLHQELRETDIPRRTKLQELIIETWRDYFQVLKDDLAVSPT